MLSFEDEICRCPKTGGGVTSRASLSIHPSFLYCIVIARRRFAKGVLWPDNTKREETDADGTEKKRKAQRNITVFDTFTIVIILNTAEKSHSFPHSLIENN